MLLQVVDTKHIPPLLMSNGMVTITANQTPDALPVQAERSMATLGRVNVGYARTGRH